MKTWNDLTNDQKAEKSDELRAWLLGQRLSNYGYDWKDFKSLSNKASRLRKKVRGGHFNPVEPNFGIFSRLEVTEKGFGYCVGQSFNEEYITLMECFTQKRGRK